jgi:hypothetical protein
MSQLAYLPLMAEFHVVIEGLELDEATTQRLNDSIQKVVLDHLADINLTRPGKEQAALLFRPHPDWRGIVAYIADQRALREVPQLRQAFERE